MDSTLYPTFKAAILAETDSTFVSYRNAGQSGYMADWMNMPSTIVVWKTSVTEDEVMHEADFNWTRVDNLTVGKARIWDWMFRKGTVNPSLSNIRAGIDAAWVGTSADLLVRAAVYVKCKRLANKVEKIFATGTGTDATPSVAGFEGQVSFSDIDNALRS